MQKKNFLFNLRAIEFDSHRAEDHKDNICTNKRKMIERKELLDFKTKKNKIIKARAKLNKLQRNAIKDWRRYGRSRHTK